MADDGNELLFGSAAPNMTFNVGDEIQGRVVKFGKTQRREVKYDRKAKAYEQGQPLYWQENGVPGVAKSDRPVEDPVFTLETAFRDWEGVRRPGSGADDGMRRVFVKGRAAEGSMLGALREACVKAKVRKVLPGDYVSIKCTGLGDVDAEAKAAGISPPKLWAAEYFSAANAPEWAKELTEAEPVGDDEDNPFA